MDVDIEQKHYDFLNEIDSLNSNTSQLKTRIAELSDKLIPEKKKKIKEKDQLINAAKKMYESKVNAAKEEIFKKITTKTSECNEKLQSYQDDINKVKTKIGEAQLKVDMIIKDTPNVKDRLEKIIEQYTAAQENYAVTAAAYERRRVERCILKPPPKR